MTIDFSQKIYNTDKFRSPAIFFKKHGYYTSAPKGTTVYLDYWNKERERCLYGFTAEDGDYITGYHYWYLNYCQILLVKEKDFKQKDGSVSKRVVKEKDFPRFYDYDRFFFLGIEEAERQGRHLIVLKARRKGYSYKVGAMLARNFYLIPSSKGYALASEMEYLVKDGILSKAWEFLDFVDENTAWTKRRHKADTKMHKRASFVTEIHGTPVEMGYKSEIMGVTLKNDPQKARGKAAKLIIFEEAGKFPYLKTAWQISRPSVEQGSYVSGTQIAFGCVCAGTKVYNNFGHAVNIEELQQFEGILGYNGQEVIRQNIIAFRKPYKTKCVKITTNSGRSLSCSYDHPIVWSKLGMSKDIPGKRSGNKRFRGKFWKWREAKDLQVGEHLGVADSIPFFGEQTIIEPRLIGWLVGDGSYGRGKTPKLFNCEKEILEYVESNFDCKVERKYLTKLGKIYKEIQIKNLCPLLRELGIYGQTKNKKRIPDILFESTEETICEFLGGFYDTDGYITDKSKRTRIILTSGHEEILLQVQSLLQKLGIHAVINKVKKSEKNPKNKNNYYRLSVSDSVSLRRFAEKIKLTPEEKNKRLLSYLDIDSGSRRHHPFFAKNIVFEKIVSVEEIGEQFVYNLTAGVSHTYLANDFITHNTGGSGSADFEGLKELFEEPVAYNCLAFPDIWDKEAPIDKIGGFFVPAWANMEGEYENPDDPNDPDNGKTFMDKDGNSNRELALKYILRERKKVIENASDRNSIDRHVAEICITPTEATLNLSANIFPKQDLIRHLAFIRNNKSVSEFKQVGDLYFDENGLVKWKQAKTPRDITKYRLNPNDDPRGQIVIWEHPVDDPPFGLYIAGCLLPGEKVVTHRGLMNIEDVTDEKLLDKDGKFVNIKEHQEYNMTDEKVYTLKMSNTFRTTTFTEEHPIYVSEHITNTQNIIDEELFNFDFKRVGDIVEKQWVKYPNVYLNLDTDYEECPTAIGGYNEDHWWFRGLWLGDGWISRNRICIAFDSTNKLQLERLKIYVKKYFNKNIYIRERGNAIEASFIHEVFSKDLIDTFGKYAKSKRIPEWIKLEKDIVKKNLLLGYLDSDGCIYKDSRDYYSLEYVSVNLELLESIQDIAFSLGLVSNLTKLRNSGEYNIAGRTGIQQEAYHLRFGHTDTIDFAKMCNFNDLSKLVKIDKENIKKTRKRAKQGCFISKDKKYIYFQIKKIKESVYTGPVYNFETETHTFCSHHIPTHNCDPYDHDQASSGSLGSCFIFKRFQNFESYYDLPVAEYTGRPNTADEFYENVRKLLLYYKATALYENEKKGIYAYFANKHAEYLLADQPGIINDIIKDSKVERKKGIHMNKPIKEWMELRVRDWLIEEYDDGKKNLTKIFSEPLLEELIAYNNTGNFDRCLLPGTNITTPEGYKNIEDVKIGDVVFSHLGERRRVTEVMVNPPTKDIYELKVSGNYETLTCTDNHPILVAYNDISPKKRTRNYKKYRRLLTQKAFVEAKDIKRGYFVLHPKRKNLQQTMLDKDLLYLLGWYISDGYVNITSNAVNFTLAKNQEEIAKELVDIINRYFVDSNTIRVDGYVDKNGREVPAYDFKNNWTLPARIKVIKGKNAIQVVKTSKELANFLTKYGGTSNNKIIHSDIYNTKGLMPLVLGYLEGDGHQRVNHSYDGYKREVIECSTIYIDLLKQIRQILIDEGIWSSIRYISNKNKKNIQPQVSISISRQYINKIAKGSKKFWLVDNIGRKFKNNSIETEEGFWSPIKEITKISYTGNTYNIEVEEDHSYIANNIAVHNCIAFGLSIIYREELYNVHVKKAERESKKSMLFDGHLDFNKDINYFNL